jgi:LysR family transcriptional regulator, transcriptional activator of nhaA
MPVRVAALLDRLNHVQLRYFWTVVREGGVARAAQVLHLSKATVSGQIKKLEESLGHRLWQQQGKRLQVTPAGSVVFDFAERIFALGEAMLSALDGSTARSGLRVGVANGVPQVVAYHQIMQALGEREADLLCAQDEIEDLLALLGAGRLDLILADAPVPPHHAIRVHNHLLDESPIALFGTPALVAGLSGAFPEALAGAPVLLPEAGSELRRSLQRWFDEHGVVVRVAGEFANTGLLKIFGAAGRGLFPAPVSVAAELHARFGCVPAGELPGCRQRCFAITAEAKPSHPLVAHLLRRGALRR